MLEPHTPAPGGGGFPGRASSQGAASQGMRTLLGPVEWQPVQHQGWCKLTLLEVVEVPELHQRVPIVVVGNIDPFLPSQGVLHPGSLIAPIGVLGGGPRDGGQCVLAAPCTGTQRLTRPRVRQPCSIPAPAEGLQASPPHSNPLPTQQESPLPEPGLSLRRPSSAGQIMPQPCSCPS